MTATNSMDKDEILRAAKVVEIIANPDSIESLAARKVDRQ